MSVCFDRVDYQRSYLDHNLRGALTEVLPAHPCDPTITVGYDHLVLALRRVEKPEVERVALAVDPLPKDRVRQPALLEVPLRVDMGLHDRGDAVACEGKRGVVDMLDPGTLRGINRVLVVLHPELVRDTWVGDDEELVGAGEGLVERGRVSVVAPTDLHAGFLDRLGCTSRIVQ